MNLVRSLYERPGQTDLMGWRHSSGGLTLGLLGLVAAAVGTAWGPSSWLAVLSAVGLLLSAVDTIIASNWSPSKVASAPIRPVKLRNDSVRFCANWPRLAGLAGCAGILEAIGTSLWLDGDRSRILQLGLVLFGYCTAYFLALLATGARIYVELNEEGIVDRARLGRARFVAWGDVEDSSVRNLSGGVTQVLLHVRGAKREGGHGLRSSNTAYINTSLIIGGADGLRAALRSRNVRER